MDERAKSEFNAALEYLERLILLKQSAATASMSFNAYEWLQSLSAIVRWVSHHMNKSEQQEARQRITKLQSMVQRGNNRNKGSPLYGMHSDTYNELHDFEIWLNEIIKEAGLYARMQDDASNALM